LTWFAALELNQTTTPTISSGRLNLRLGLAFVCYSSPPLRRGSQLAIMVANHPGVIALTRIPLVSISPARCLVMWWTAALLAAYPVRSVFSNTADMQSDHGADSDDPCGVVGRGCLIQKRDHLPDQVEDAADVEAHRLCERGVRVGIEWGAPRSRPHWP
jgi:hypothetical protein